MRASKEEGEVPSPPSSRAQRVLTRVNSLFPSKPAMRAIRFKAKRYRYQRKNAKAQIGFSRTTLFCMVYSKIVMMQSHYSRT